ncbi:DUF2087 domain-containing protein [Alloscardovia venturai]|uniref:DUF2087 domain-containing protein n=1 Tax=Alloscardovia venturai TaxID=1769421 RepID=A0ABW2Y2H8_9BIFI
MPLSQDIQTIVKQYRIILTSLRTPKLRQRFKELLELQDTQSNVSPVTDTSLDKPFQQVDWLNTSLTNSQDILGRDIDALDVLLGEDSIMYTSPISELPVPWEERKALVRSICERVFAVPIAHRDWLSETEYNARLSMLVTDAVTLRRYSVDMGIVRRNDRGERYWLVKE